mmetsp:Transcript_35004/g.78783  ORF Transcript_35004/g.78783 Transcript_35004/m.78783 type:complete len:252 (+) Transcript_35004:1056-1811(+)
MGARLRGQSCNSNCKFCDTMTAGLPHCMVWGANRVHISIDDAVKVRHQEGGPAGWATHHAPSLLRVQLDTLSNIVPVQAHWAKQDWEEVGFLRTRLLHKRSRCNRSSVADLAPIVPDARCYQHNYLRCNACHECGTSLTDLYDVLQRKVSILTDETVCVLAAPSEQIQQHVIDTRSEAAPAALHHGFQGAHGRLQCLPTSGVWQEARWGNWLSVRNFWLLAFAMECRLDVIKNCWRQSIVNCQALTLGTLQ